MFGNIQVQANVATKKNEVIHKWTYDEITQILDYILDKGDLLLPPERINYEQLSAVIDVHPRLIKFKVRHLKNMYLKTVDWLRKINSQGVQQCELDEVKRQIRKMCPHYARLHQIFSLQELKTDAEALDSTKELHFDAFLAALDDERSGAAFDIQLESTGIEQPSQASKTAITSNNGSNNLDQLFCGSDEEDDTSLFEKHYQQASTKPIADTKSQSTDEAETLKRARLHLECEKLEFERFKFEKIYELKKLEMDRNYELKKMELAQDGRYFNLKRSYQAAFELQQME